MYASDKSEASKAGIEGYDILASGLRMLRGLAWHKPVELSAFAEMNALSLRDAARFMNAFEHCGYVCQIPFSGLYMLTPQAMSIVSAVCKPRAPTAPTLQ